MDTVNPIASDILVILNGLFCIVVTVVTTKIMEATYVKETVS